MTESGTRESGERVAISVIVLVTERPEPLPELYHELGAALRPLGRPFEFIFAMAPGREHLAASLAPHHLDGAPVRVLSISHAAGEATLVNVAASQCRGSTIVIMPAYRRVEASAIATLVAGVEAGADLVVARRWPRRDSWFNRFQNRAFHALLRAFVGGKVHDVACGVRAMRAQLLREIPLYGDFVRYLPVLAMREGYRVEEVSVPQHPRDAETRVHGPGVYLRRLIDVLGLAFLVRFTEKPLRFFGVAGTVLGVTGAVVLTTVAIQRLGGEPIADRPMLLFGVLLLVLGVQAIALGLVGEIIVHLNATRRRPYRLARPDRDDRSAPDAP